MTELAEKIFALKAQGYSYRRIQEELQCSKSTVSYYLSEGQKEKTQERTQKVRRTLSETIRKIKEETPCADCGKNYPYYVMDFDHLEDKSFGISDAINRRRKSLKAVLEEIAKCEVVCANCHRGRTHSRLTT